MSREDSFFDESRRLDPAGAVTAAIEMLRVGSDVVDVDRPRSHPDARPVSPADEIRRIAPLLDALSDQMHRVSIDSFQPETQRYALKRGVGYLNDIQGFPDPALYPILLRRTAGWWLCTQRSGWHRHPHRSPSTRRRARRDCAVLRGAGFRLATERGRCDRLILDRGWDFS
ncbi:dihydropteroate synthase [Klebsiella variicola]|uniref:dihydropteroate synthase n=1 Tax=Klebsiella variicola TaxID=244366 RepID=UPI0039779BA7